MMDSNAKAAEKSAPLITRIARLDDICIQVIAENFPTHPILDEILAQYQESVVASVDLEKIKINTVAKQVICEILWERMALDRWSHGCRVELCGSSWKRLYLERHVQELLEGYFPTSADLEENFNWKKLVDGVVSAAPYIHTIKLTQLLSHLDLAKVFSHFPNLSTLDITYGASDLGMNYDKQLFGMRLTDALSMAKLLQITRTLSRLVLSECLINDEVLHLLMSGLANNDTITSLDLSHNKIGDVGARRIAGWLMKDNVLMSLDLSDNFIRVEGASNIGQALSNNMTLLELNLRLNRLGDEGGTRILGGVKVNNTLKKLNISANDLGRNSAAMLLSLLQKNTTLRELDISCNKELILPDENIEDVDGRDVEKIKNFKTVLGKNVGLVKIDLRHTPIPSSVGSVLFPRDVKSRQKRRKNFLDKSWQDHPSVPI